MADNAERPSIRSLRVARAFDGYRLLADPVVVIRGATIKAVCNTVPPGSGIKEQ